MPLPQMKAVAELLDPHSPYHFLIPSYQRGYRWTREQVGDLLNDISEFANPVGGDAGTTTYCLHPLVVKRRKWLRGNAEIEGWEVIDGQQRLSTLLLLIQVLLPGYEMAAGVAPYSLHYESRPQLDFTHLVPSADIDSAFLYEAKEQIAAWVGTTNCLLNVRKCLLERLSEGEVAPQVKFIWYEVAGALNADAIRTFANLNQGKIPLSDADLIKALFVQDIGRNRELWAGVHFATEWNRMEIGLQQPEFWGFLSPGIDDGTARIGLILNLIITRKEQGELSPYRYYQQLYGRGGNGLRRVWDEALRCYGMLRYLFDDQYFYHYVGYLVTCRKLPLGDIYALAVGKSIRELRTWLREEVGRQLGVACEDDIDGLRYNPEQSWRIRELLLLANVELCARSEWLRFPFAKFKELGRASGWEVEHISPQAENSLASRKDRREWLGYLLDDNIEYPPALCELCGVENWEKLREEAQRCYELLERKEDVLNSERFVELYQSVMLLEDAQAEDWLGRVKGKNGQADRMPLDKNAIGNLTLLNSRQNRALGNALFSTKQQKVLDASAKGQPVLPLTLEVFGKLNTKRKDSAGRWKNAWTREDAQIYRARLLELVGGFLGQNLSTTSE